MTTTQAALLEALREALSDADKAIVDVSFKLSIVDPDACRLVDALNRIRAALRAAEAAQPEPVALGLSPAQEPKYTVNGRAIVNRSSGEAIPEDEPVFIFRARDVHAREALEAYACVLQADSHRDAVVQRVADFAGFERAHPERMKVPDTDAAPPQPAPIDVERMLAECVPGGSSCDPQQVADAIRSYCNAWEQPAPSAAQAGPAQAPLTDGRLRTMAAEAESPEWGEWYSDDDALIRFARAVERAAQAPESTRPADASISGRRVDMSGWKWVPVELTVDMESAAYDTRVSLSHDDVCAIWSAVIAAAPQAPAEQRCACGDRPASQCPGEWEPGCDLGANEKHARVAPEGLMLNGLTEAETAQSASVAGLTVAPAEQPADVFSLMLHSKPQHEDAPENALVDMPPPVLTESEQDAAVKRALAIASTSVAPAEPAAQAVEQDATLPVHEVWREGYRITGETARALKLGEARAFTFEEACDIVCADMPGYSGRAIWGCRLFNNEADARKAFG